jgi:hypothetical protein
MSAMNIVEKIKKLLALSESSNANEAALAAQRAQELMVKYAIDEAALAPAERVVEAIESERIQTDYNRIPSWRPLLAYVLAPSFFCRSFFTRGSKWSKAALYFVGRTSDRASLILTYNILATQIEKMADAGWAQVNKEFTEIHGKRWKAAFYEGVCRTVESRLTMNRRQLAIDNANTAIVLSNKDKEIEEYLKANHSLKSSGRSRNVDSDGFKAGVQAGHTLNLGARNTKQLSA